MCCGPAFDRLYLCHDRLRIGKRELAEHFRVLSLVVDYSMLRIYVCGGAEIGPGAEARSARADELEGLETISQSGYTAGQRLSTSYEL